MSFKDDIWKRLRQLMESDIDGCITGSLFGEIADFDDWDTKPDIDVFCYSREAQCYAVSYLMNKMGLVPKGDRPEFTAGEKSKIGSLLHGGYGRGKLITLKFGSDDDDVIVNISTKNHRGQLCNTVGAVLGTFDMSIIMKGYDILSGNYLDMREQQVIRKDMVDVLGVSESNPLTAIPNQFRFYNYATWEVARYLRQWERVLKYSNRGYDMLPLAKFYKLMIDKTIDNGKMFKTENYGQAYDAFVEDYSALASTIDNWIKEHE